jgi:hypothetical protein
MDAKGEVTEPTLFTSSDPLGDTYTWAGVANTCVTWGCGKNNGISLLMYPGGTRGLGGYPSIIIKHNIFCLFRNGPLALLTLSVF